VWVPSPPPAKAVYLSWTEDEALGTGNQDWARLMMRYDVHGVQIDFRGGAMGSNYGTPASGLWHHIAVARAASEMLTFYVDGVPCNQGGQGNVNLQAGKPLALGGVLRVGTSAYTNFFAGALSRVRVHTGTLSEDDVRHNYLTDVPSYRAGGYAVWNGGTGDWNDPAFWQDGRVGAGLDAVRIQSGSLTVTNDDMTAGSLAMLDLRTGTLKLTTSAARIDSRTPFLVGRESGQAAAINVSSGVLHVVSSGNPAYLDLGVNGALSTLEVGGSGTAATLYTAQLRAFAEGTSDIRVMKGGVIEMDALFADALSVPSVSVAGGTFRNRTGGTMGYFFNVPQVNVSTDGVTFDTPAGAVMAVSAPLLHDASGPDSGGGLRKIGAGRWSSAARTPTPARPRSRLVPWCLRPGCWTDWSTGWTPPPTRSIPSRSMPRPTCSHGPIAAARALSSRPTKPRYVRSTTPRSSAVAAACVSVAMPPAAGWQPTGRPRSRRSSR
jgi:hypothetical protein